MEEIAFTDPNHEALPVNIPDHELLRRIGRGSYGEIWLARNVMGAYRGVKVVYRSSFKDDRPFERELSGIRKYEPISRSHEKFIDVLQIGINKEHGYFYYVMELGDDCVTGQTIDPDNYTPKTLTRALRGGAKLSFADCLDLGLSLSQALVELHKHGLVHRDIKPSNIIFVNGVAKLADIGLVADVSEARSFVGTEGYIPPEGPGTPTADVFSLGKVLYEASTGKDRLQFPELPTMLGASAEQDKLLELNEVILQACQSDCRKRYPGAWEMYSDLLVIADGKSVKRLRFLERRLAQFKRAAVATAAALLIAGGVGYHLYRESLNARETRQRHVGENVANGVQAIKSWDLTSALPFFANAVALDSGDEKSAATHRFMFANVLTHCPKLVRVFSTTGEVHTVQFSPNDEQILISDGRARILQVAAGAEGVERSFGTNVFKSMYSPDGNFVATLEESSVNIWRVSDAVLVASLPHDGGVTSACFSPDGLRIVTGCEDGTLRIWNIQTKALICNYKGHDRVIRCVAFAPNGGNIVSTSEDSTARIWTANGEAVGEPIKCSGAIMHGSFSPDGNQLVIATQDHYAYVWDIVDGHHLRGRLAHGDLVNNAVFSPDARFILTASFDHTARLWSAETHEARYPIGCLRHFDRVYCACFSSDTRRIATGSIDGTVCIWDFAGSELLPESAPGRYSLDGKRFITFTNNVAEVVDAISGRSIAPLQGLTKDADFLDFTKDGHFLLSCITNLNDTGAGRTFSVWNCDEGRLVSPPLAVTNSAKGAVSGNGKHLVVFAEKWAHVWGLPITNDKPRVLELDATNTSAFFNHDGTRLVIVSGNLVHVWNTLTGLEIFPPLKHAIPVLHAEFNPDETRLVTGSQNRGLDKCDAQLWDATTGQLLLTFKHGDGVLWASFSPDGTLLVTACEDHSASVWSTRDGHPVCRPLMHDGPIDRVMFSSDSKKIVTASEDSTARVWDAETGDPLTPPLEHFGGVKRAAFLPGDDRIVTTTEGNQNWVWHLPVETRPLPDLLSLSQLLAGRPLGSATPVGETPAVLWSRLYKSYPELFQTTTNEIIAWEEYSARDCRRHHYRPGEISHWKRLLELRPDPRIKLAIDETEKKLKPKP